MLPLRKCRLEPMHTDVATLQGEPSDGGFMLISPFPVSASKRRWPISVEQWLTSEMTGS